MATIKEVGSVLTAIGETASGLTGQLPGVGGIILGVIGGTIALAGDLMQTSDSPIIHITRIRSAEADRVRIEKEVHDRIHGT